MKRPPKIYSPARRALRVMVWTTFAVVFLARMFLFRPEPNLDRPHRVGFVEHGDRRFRHAPTFLAPPVAPVPNDLYRLQIEIADPDVERLRGYYWNGWRGQRAQERPEVLATVHEGDRIYTNVTLHLKGAAGSFRAFDDKPALTLNFSKRAKGQRFHGLSKLSLNNSVQDPTFLCEALSRELFLKAGVPVPQADFATVLINGRDLGLYVLLEGYNKEFLRKYFSDVSGNLYDGGFCQEVHRNLAVNSGDDQDDRSDLDRLLRAVNDTFATHQADRLREVLDTDRFTTLLALEILLCHWDGYALNRNNYRLFHDRSTGRMVFMPHGLDQLFETPRNRYPVNGSIQPVMQGRIAQAWLSTPEGARQYFERLRTLQATVFQEEPILARVREMNERLRPTLQAYSPSLASQHDLLVNSMRERIRWRIQSVSDQLQSLGESPQFDAAGMAPLQDWPQPSTGRRWIFHPAPPPPPTRE